MTATSFLGTAASSRSQARVFTSNVVRPGEMSFLKPFSRPLCLRSTAPTRSVVICSFGRDPRFRQGDPFRSSSGQNRSSSRRDRPPSSENVKIVMREYAVPAIAVFAAATLLGPLIGAVAFASVATVVALAGVVAAFSLSWLFVPLILSFMGIPLLLGGGLVSSLFAGAAGVILFPAFLQIGLLVATMWLGANIARRMFFPEEDVYENYPGNVDARNAVVDVDSSTVDEIEREMEAEAKRREQELRDFDDLLKRRGKFQRDTRD